jgi:hypothetical protein
MSNTKKNNSGLLVCGACAVSADPNASSVTSVDTVARVVKGVFSKVHRRK